MGRPDRGEGDGATRPRGGFSLVELLIVVSIGSVLLAVGLPPVAALHGRRALINAQDATMALAAQARAGAIERGQVVVFEVDPAADRARVYVQATGAVLTTRDYSEDFAADAQTGSGATVRVCYTPRGYARQSCSGTALPATVTLARSGDTAGVRFGGLGQTERE